MSQYHPIDNVSIVVAALDSYLRERVGDKIHGEVTYTTSEWAKYILKDSINVDCFLNWTRLAETITAMGGTTSREDIRNVCHTGFNTQNKTDGARDFILALQTLANKQLIVDLERFM